MLETSARLLRVLSLLHARPEWSGAALAARLGVSARTVRRDVDRLRALGYPVQAARGAAGYRLGAGAALPPLLLDDEEAVAVAVGLRTAAGGTVSGIEEASLRALAKLEQVLPSRLRPRVNALQTYIAPPRGADLKVDSDVLAALASACRDHLRLRLDYHGHDGAATIRAVEPYRLVHTGRRWYLVAWDTDREDWRTYRVDRIRPHTPAGPRFTPRVLPAEDVAAYVARGVATTVWRYRARARLHAPAEAVADRLPPSVLLAAIDDRTCEIDIGADTLPLLAAYLGALDVDFDLRAPPELLDYLREVAARYQRAAPEAGRSGARG